MLDIMFHKPGNDALVRINNKKLLFAKVSSGHLLWSDLKGLKFSVAGCIAKFPDLKDLPNSEVIEISKKRFMEHINKLETEDKIKDYLIDDLRKHGFKPKYIQKKGHRIQKWHSQKI